MTSNLTQEEVNQINADIRKNQEAVIQKQEATTIKDAKDEARKELLAEQKLQSLEQQNVNMAEMLKKQTEANALQMKTLQDTMDKKIESLVSSRQVVSNNDPFVEDSTPKTPNVNLSDVQADDIEKQSARAFFEATSK